MTTRTLEQYRRVDLGIRPRFAVTANGGTLLVDGVPDPRWQRTVRHRLAGRGRPLPEVAALAERWADPSWVRTMRVADDFFVYLVAHERELIPDLTDLEAELAAAGWTLSVQGRKVYLVPAALTKQAALAEVVGAGRRRRRRRGRRLAARRRDAGRGRRGGPPGARRAARRGLAPAAPARHRRRRAARRGAGARDAAGCRGCHRHDRLRFPR